MFRILVITAWLTRPSVLTSASLSKEVCWMRISLTEYACGKMCKCLIGKKCWKYDHDKSKNIGYRGYRPYALICYNFCHPTRKKIVIFHSNPQGPIVVSCILLSSRHWSVTQRYHDGRTVYMRVQDFYSNVSGKSLSAKKDSNEINICRHNHCMYLLEGRRRTEWILLFHS